MKNKYRIIPYYYNYNHNEHVRYKLQKRGWFNIWWTINETSSYEKLKKDVDELTKEIYIK